MEIKKEFTENNASKMVKIRQLMDGNYISVLCVFLLIVKIRPLMDGNTKKDIRKEINTC